MTNPNTGDPRADAWITGYAEGLVEGVEQGRWKPDPKFTCACGVMSGGIRDVRRSCPVHGGVDA